MQFTQFTAARADTGAVLPYARCTVYLTGTSTKASLYLADGVTATANPASGNVTGAVGFAAPDGFYDFSIASADGQYAAPLLSSFQFYTPSAGNYQGDSATLLQIKKASGTPAFNFSTIEGFVGSAGTATSGAGRMTIGTNTPSGDDSAVLICRNLAGSNLFDHAVRDETGFTSTSTGAFASFDSAATMSGTIHYNHLRGYQARMTYSGSGLLDEMNAFGWTPIITGGSVGNVYGLHIVNAALSGGAAITGQQTGLYIEALTGAAGGNYGIYVNANDNILLGNLQIAGSLIGVTALTASGQVQGGSFAATSTTASYAGGGGVAVSTNGVQAYSNSSGTGKTLGLNLGGGGIAVGSAALPVYADNAGATTAGLAVGTIYRTATGVVMARY